MSTDYEVDDTVFIKNLFHYLDKDKNGSIEFDEFKTIAEIFEDYINEEELREYFDEVDINNDQLISFEGKYIKHQIKFIIKLLKNKKEFEQNGSIRLMNKYFMKLMNNADQTVKYIFDYLDKNKDNFLDYEEFKLLSELDDFKEMNEDDLRECFEEIDLNNDGKISFEGLI